VNKEGAGWQRIVVEKQFGHDLASAQALNRELTRYAHEQQVFRIDHYLGKETVQNILMFRFSNSIFERLWNRESVDSRPDHRQRKNRRRRARRLLRGSGALRDMVQNHMLQVLSLIAMEPPVSLEAEAVRDEKSEVAQIHPRNSRRRTWRNRSCADNTSPASSHEARPATDRNEGGSTSNVETYAALKLFIDNWRWSGSRFICARAKTCR